MLKSTVYLLVLGVTGMGLGLIIGDEGPPGAISKKSSVYFPVLLEDFKDLGIKAGRSRDGFAAERKKKVDISVPTTTKPTTTTDRLPLNPHGFLNHVALEPVTKPPGPSYLTDSYYYLNDHTPLPGSMETDDDLPHDRESENEELQNLTPFSSRFFAKETPTAHALADPKPAHALADPTPTHALADPTLTHVDDPTPTQPEKTIKLRPAYIPIPTPTPQTRVPTTSRARENYTPTRGLIQTRAREVSRAPGRAAPRPATGRLVSRRPKFESSRLANIPYQTTTATPTPTPAARGYGTRAPLASAPGRKGRTQDAPVYRTSTKAYRAPSSLYHGRGAAVTTVTAPSQPDFVQSDRNIYVPVEYDEEAIPGDAGVDYPVYETVPVTSFACQDQDHPGLYADVEAQCQTFHICQEDGRHDSFLCPNGTVFNQQYFVCDWWYNFSCDHATRFYGLNALIYELPDANKYARK
nr:mucin-2-like [Procambarus clarkii]